MCSARCREIDQHLIKALLHKQVICIFPYLFWWNPITERAWMEEDGFAHPIQSITGFADFLNYLEVFDFSDSSISLVTDTPAYDSALVD